MTRVRVALRARGSADDRGSSLTELLVVMLITSVVMVTVVSMTIGFQRTNAQNVVRQDQIDAARTAVERMSKTTRTAVKPSVLSSTCATTFCTEDAFIRAGKFGMQFYANLNNDKNLVGPSRVTYTLTTTGTGAGELVEKVQVPDSNVPGASGYVYCLAEATTATAACKARLTTRVVARGVVATAAAPLITYYDTNGTVLVPDATTDTLSPVDLGNVLSMELQVKVHDTGTIQAGPTTYIQRVTMPNAQAVIRQGSED